MQVLFGENYRQMRSLPFPSRLRVSEIRIAAGTVGRLRLADVERSELLGSVKNRQG